jgi:hypothetical protein
VSKRKRWSEAEKGREEERETETEKERETETKDAAGPAGPFFLFLVHSVCPAQLLLHFLLFWPTFFT